ncbi:MAG: HPP family protein [Candidatus Woesearchaeota archaeon]
MDFQKFLRKEKKIWHKRFLPSLAAALLAGFISYVIDFTLSNVVLFASVGASAFILTNANHHHLATLRTTILAYVIALIISSFVYMANKYYPLHMSVNIFLLVFFVGISLYLFNAIHPPAISVSLSFILLKRSYVELIYIVIAIFLLFIIVRLITYAYSGDLSIRHFGKEFRKH